MYLSWINYISFCATEKNKMYQILVGKKTYYDKPAVSPFLIIKVSHLRISTLTEYCHQSQSWFAPRVYNI